LDSNVENEDMINPPPGRVYKSTTGGIDMIGHPIEKSTTGGTEDMEDDNNPEVENQNFADRPNQLRMKMKKPWIAGWEGASENLVEKANPWKVNPDDENKDMENKNPEAEKIKNPWEAAQEPLSFAKKIQTELTAPDVQVGKAVDAIYKAGMMKDLVNMIEKTNPGMIKEEIEKIYIAELLAAFDKEIENEIAKADNDDKAKAIKESYMEEWIRHAQEKQQWTTYHGSANLFKKEFTAYADHAEYAEKIDRGIAESMGNRMGNRGTYEAYDVIGKEYAALEKAFGEKHNLTREWMNPEESDNLLDSPMGSSSPELKKPTDYHGNPPNPSYAKKKTIPEASKEHIREYFGKKENIQEKWNKKDGISKNKKHPKIYTGRKKSVSFTKEEEAQYLAETIRALQQQFSALTLDLASGSNEANPNNQDHL